MACTANRDVRHSAIPKQQAIEDSYKGGDVMGQQLWRAPSLGSRADSGERGQAMLSQRRSLHISEPLPRGSGRAQVTTETPMCYDAPVRQDRKDSSAGRCLPPNRTRTRLFVGCGGRIFDALEGNLPRGAERQRE